MAPGVQTKMLQERPFFVRRADRSFRIIPWENVLQEVLV